MLGEYFDPFTKAEIPSPVIHLSASPRHQPLKMLLDEIASLRHHAAVFSELMVRGNLYKAFGYILSNFIWDHGGQNAKKLRNVAKVEQALELIHTQYATPLSVDHAAHVTGYGKANFCKVFKQITGDTFHHSLNACRLENACLLLKNSPLSVDDIALQVGLTDAKTLCRIFKKTYGRTTVSNYSFDSQADLYVFKPTVYHHREWAQMEALADRFLNEPAHSPRLFYIWGHAYEFDIYNQWNAFEKFLARLSGHSDVFYGTNSQVLLGK